MTMTMIEDIGVTKAEAREILGVNRVELDRLIEQGELHVSQIGHYRRIPNYVLRGYMRRQQALLIVHNCVRNNTSLEGLHWGTFPRSETGDYSDVKVVSPYGEIPWTEVARMSQEEMKRLMKEIVNNVFTLLDCDTDELINLQMPQGWDRPDWNRKFLLKTVDEAEQGDQDG